MKVKELLDVISPVENILIMDYYEDRVLASYWFDEEECNIDNIEDFNDIDIVYIEHGMDNITIITDIK